jgi:hypothetical protein
MIPIFRFPENKITNRLIVICRYYNSGRSRKTEDRSRKLKIVLKQPSGILISSENLKRQPVKNKMFLYKLPQNKFFDAISGNNCLLCGHLYMEV